MRFGVARLLLVPVGPLLAVMAAASFLNPANAQTVARPVSGTTPAGGARTSETTQPPSILERQYLMRAMEIEAGKPPTKDEKKLALAQIAEDYVRIQVINNKMMSAVMSAAAPNYATIAQTTSEIGKRARRIKINLPLPDDDSENSAAKPAEYKNVVDPAGMKTTLLFLDARIMSFVNNPIFQNTSVVDVSQAARAKRDLETIVEFSNLIGKDARKLRKSSGKRP